MTSLIENFTSDLNKNLRFGYITNPNCIPDDDEVQTFQLENLSITKGRNIKHWYLPMINIKLIEYSKPIDLKIGTGFDITLNSYR